MSVQVAGAKEGTVCGHERRCKNKRGCQSKLGVLGGRQMRGLQSRGCGDNTIWLCAPLQQYLQSHCSSHAVQDQPRKLELCLVQSQGLGQALEVPLPWPQGPEAQDCMAVAMSQTWRPEVQWRLNPLGIATSHVVEPQPQCCLFSSGCTVEKGVGLSTFPHSICPLEGRA